MMLFLSTCVVSNSKKLRFTEQLEASGLLSSTGMKTPLSEIPSVGPILF